jgi:hypothetical protein
MMVFTLLFLQKIDISLTNKGKYGKYKIHHGIKILQWFIVQIVEELVP